MKRRDRALDRFGPIGRIVVPRTLVRDILNVYHGIPLTGHLGKDKTVHAISTHFYWKGLTKDVTTRVKGCHLCQMRKQTRPMRHMHPGGFKADEPFEVVVMDMVTKLPESDGNVLLFTIVDVFSKLVIAVPVPNEKSETVGRALQEKLFSVHGYPKILVSDRAQGFVSDGLKWLCKHLGVAKINTTGLLPTGASPVERYHRSLGASLTMICNKAKKDWAFLVDSVTFAYNISVNESTGFSPYYLTTGRHPNLPFSVLTGLKAATVSHVDHKFVERMTKALNDASGFVRERQLKTLERNKRVQLNLSSKATTEEVEQALDNRKIPEFLLGELVSFWEPEAKDVDILNVIPQKLQNRWQGPYCIISRDGDHYEIDRRGVRLLVNPNRLRRYYSWISDQEEQAP